MLWWVTEREVTVPAIAIPLNTQIDIKPQAKCTITSKSLSGWVDLVGMPEKRKKYFIAFFNGHIFSHKKLALIICYCWMPSSSVSNWIVPILRWNLFPAGFWKYRNFCIKVIQWKGESDVLMTFRDQAVCRTATLVHCT